VDRCPRSEGVRSGPAALAVKALHARQGRELMDDPRPAWLVPPPRDWWIDASATTGHGAAAREQRLLARSLARHPMNLMTRNGEPDDAPTACQSLPSLPCHEHFMIEPLESKIGVCSETQRGRGCDSSGRLRHRFVDLGLVCQAKINKAKSDSLRAVLYCRRSTPRSPGTAQLRRCAR